VTRAALAEAGFDDLPRNGAFMLAWLVHTGNLGHVASALGVSKQAVSQLIDTMVLRGYLEREVDPNDRRRMIVTPTARGEAAERAAARAADRVDAELGNRIGPEGLAALRSGLIALADLMSEQAAAGDLEHAAVRTKEAGGVE
jgi:DNA-binding MarR family transcriptional regulator